MVSGCIGDAICVHYMPDKETWLLKPGRLIPSLFSRSKAGSEGRRRGTESHLKYKVRNSLNVLKHRIVTFSLTPLMEIARPASYQEF